MEGCLTQGLVALTGLRTLGFGRVAPVGLLCMEGCLTQGLVALVGLRTLGFGRDRPYRGLHGRWGSRGGAFPKPCRGDPQSGSLLQHGPFL